MFFLARKYLKNNITPNLPVSFQLSVCYWRMSALSLCISQHWQHVQKCPVGLTHLIETVVWMKQIKKHSSLITAFLLTFRLHHPDYPNLYSEFVWRVCVTAVCCLQEPAWSGCVPPDEKLTLPWRSRRPQCILSLFTELDAVHLLAITVCITGQIFIFSTKLFIYSCI